MPSIEEVLDIARPLIEEGQAKAALEERLYTLEDVKRYADRVGDARTSKYCDLNIKLIRAAETL